MAAAAVASICCGPQAVKAGGGVPGGVNNSPPRADVAEERTIPGEPIAHAPPIVSIAGVDVPIAPSLPIVPMACAGVGEDAQTLAVGGGRVGVVGAPRGNGFQTAFFGMAWTYVSFPDVWL